MYSTEEAYKYCEEVIKHHSKTFYKTFSILSKDERRAVWAVYAFCRTVDDIVDEGIDPERELAEFKKVFEQFLQHTYDEADPMWVALYDVFMKYKMDKQAFHSLIKGKELDLSVNRYDTMDQLLNYCSQVAGTVGLMLLPILASEKAALLRDGAVSLGIAMQLTNILYNIEEDLERNRIYLPKDVMKYCGLRKEALWLGRIDHSFIQVWEHLAEVAEQFYNEAFRSMDEYPIYSRIPVKRAAYLSHKILSVIRSKRYKVFKEKHFTMKKRKRLILVRT
ncbi:phytoene/squalene synthase family protein [Metabacillus fastidiosus]|uniref:phytoene/squalene synthase family protein n=1 Tax=Metabacillus fastidiosus TaxID=1458 RepID=UPI000825EDFC|nr:phytoene/squalene synthase family protein [Metabacillus fastidiosus]MED4461015.1 phytoene/squalene synthase family protein [Metabacillus fastidiosus]